MHGTFGISTAIARLKSRAVGPIALTALTVMAAPAAWAQPPTANSLPGGFSTNDAAVTYTGSGATATIATGAGADVLQWGGTALPNTVAAPAGLTATPNTGFSIGSGATLTIGGGAAAVLVTDLTGSASQIFGTLNAGTPGPLYVSNTNGVIVGATGVINAAAPGVGLLGYAVDATTFAGSGTISVDSTTSGAGDVTVTAGATLAGFPLLVATNGTVNIGAVSPGANFVLAGWGFTTAGGSVAPTPAGAALTSGTSSVVNVTPAAGNATLSLTLLDAGGAVNNSANLNVPAALNVAGLFTNSGVLNDNALLAANQLAGGLVNTGVINEAAPALMILSTNGNIQSTGTLNMAAAGQPLTLMGANVDLEGSVTAAGTALSATNPVGALNLSTTATPAQSGGVIDIGTSLFSSGGALVAGNAIRVVSGGITDSGGVITLNPGTGAANVPDPFYNLASLGYTLSLFPGTLIQETAAGGAIVAWNPVGSTSFTNSAGMNLDGQLSVTGAGGPSINVAANNINSNNGLNGGFSVPNGGVINLQFFGNVNNPGGAAANGSTSFFYNYVPVTVGPNGSAAGTVLIGLAGPSSASATNSNVNLLVQGNAQLRDGPAFFGGPLTAPTLPTAVQSPYANNHLVVTATGDIGFDPSVVPQPPQANGASLFYWPGLVYLTAGATASDPTAPPNSTASVALGDAGGVFTGGVPVTVNFENLLAADLTTASINGEIGGGGVHFLSSNVILAPGANATGTVTVSNNSWVNFLTSTLASAFQTAQGSQFFGGVITASTVNTQQLPADDFQPK